MYVVELAGEDDAFAAAEVRTAAADLEIIGPGVAISRHLDPVRFRKLAFAHRASALVASCDADVADAAAHLETADLDPRGIDLGEAIDDGLGSIAVRARDVRGTAGVDTQAAERTLGAVLVDRGFSIDLEDPDAELIALFAGEDCVLGSTVAVADRGFGDRAPTDRPFFQPGSMAPQLARAVVNLARTSPGDVVLDPMCGTGGLLIEAGLVGARPLGFDAQPKMVDGTRRNLQAYLTEVPSVGLADATSLPLVDGAVDVVVFDAPYGRQSKIATHELSDLIAGALREAARVGDRCVMVADRDWTSLLEGTGWQVAARYERRVHRSLVRHVHVLERG